MTTTVRDVLYGVAEDGRPRITQSFAGSLALSHGLTLEAVVKAIWDVLDLPLGDLIFRAWDKYEAVEKAKTETKGIPGARKQIEIAGHTLRSTQHPKIEAYLSDQRILEVTLELEIALKIEAVTVTVIAGEVAEIGPGRAIAEASLTGPLGVTLVPKQSVEVELPGSIRQPTSEQRVSA